MVVCGCGLWVVGCAWPVWIRPVLVQLTDIVYLVVVSLTNATLDGPGYDAVRGGGPGCQLADLRFHSMREEAGPGDRGRNTKMTES